MAGVIEWDKIAELLWVAPLAALIVSIAFSLIIMASSRATDARRAGAGTVAMAYSVVTLLATAGFIAVVVYGVAIIIKK